MSRGRLHPTGLTAHNQLLVEGRILNVDKVQVEVEEPDHFAFSF
jgi:hypothetical protein